MVYVVWCVTVVWGAVGCGVSDAVGVTPCGHPCVFVVVCVLCLLTVPMWWCVLVVGYVCASDLCASVMCPLASACVRDASPALFVPLGGSGVAIPQKLELLVS